MCRVTHTSSEVAVSATAPSEPSACHITATEAIYVLAVPHVMAMEAVHKLPVLHITATEAIHACSIMKSVYVSAPLWPPDPPTPPWWCPALLATPWPSEPPGVSPLLNCPWPRLLPYDPLFCSPCPPLLHDPGHHPGPLPPARLSIPPPWTSSASPPSWTFRVFWVGVLRREQPFEESICHIYIGFLHVFMSFDFEICYSHVSLFLPCVIFSLVHYLVISSII